MVRRTKSAALECALVDLNTQTDFLDPEGAYPVANLQELIPALRCVIAWAKRNHAPVISSIAAHRRHELADCREPANCLDGTEGQRKLDFTILASHTNVEFDNTLCVPMDLFSVHQQVIFRKRQDDLLGNPKADRFLTQLPTGEYILFGIGIECSIRVLALGLLARHRRVTVITDACGYWDKGKADLALRQVSAKGAVLMKLDELLSRKLRRRRRYPQHAVDEDPRCQYGLLSPRKSGNGRHRGNNNAAARRAQPKDAAVPPPTHKRKTG